MWIECWDVRLGCTSHHVWIPFKLWPWLAGVFAYGVGAALYATHTPERYFKGKLDFFGCGHNLFHFGCFIGAAFHMWGSINVFHERQMFSCPETGLSTNWFKYHLSSKIYFHIFRNIRLFPFCIDVLFIRINAALHVYLHVCALSTRVRVRARVRLRARFAVDLCLSKSARLHSFSRVRLRSRFVVNLCSTRPSGGNLGWRFTAGATSGIFTCILIK